MFKQSIIIIFITLLFVKASLANSPGLFPEDGSMPISKWYYSGGKTGPKIPSGVISDIESAFRSEGIETIVFPHYQWMQDILFIDQNGDFLELADFSTIGRYFDDLTLGVFEDEGWSSRINKLREKEFSPFLQDNEIKKLNHTFLEGGATISGKFASGENYLITYQERINRLIMAGKERNKALNNEQIMSLILEELNLKASNLFLIPQTAGSEHLDLFMKAMPNGVLIIDDPFARGEILTSLIENTQNDEFQKMLNFETDPNLVYKRNTYLKKIKIVNELLKDRFKIISFSGRFFQNEPTSFGSIYTRELVNFFNSVSGSNQSNSYFITNKADKAPELETIWSEFLNQNFGIETQHIHFVGEYSGGSGLDCMGTSAP